MNQQRTSLNMQENVAGALCYVLGWITGIVFFVMEEESRFVRFHAMQSIITFLPLSIIAFFIGFIFSLFIPFVGWLFSGLIWLLVFVLWLILMLKAYQGILFKVPIVGDIAEDMI